MSVTCEGEGLNRSLNNGEEIKILAFLEIIEWILFFLNK